MAGMRKNCWKLLLLIVCLSFPVVEAQAQNDEAFLQYRQKVMKSLGASMGAIGDILKYKLPYQNHILTHAKDINQASALVAEAFKKEITAGKTDAKPEIWKDWDKFIAAVEAVRQESAKLAEANQSNGMAAVGAQVKKVGESCGGCHKPFRKPKEERFKR